MPKKDNKKFSGPLVLAILDGFGVSPEKEGNAIYLARTPFFDETLKKYPNTTLSASGRSVGLADNQRGNSEAGHLNLGAGRIVEQDLVLISREIKSGRFFKNSAFTSVIDHVQKNNSQMHLIGLLSGKQSPHVEMSHVYALLRLLDQEGIEKIYLHLFTDGRDAPMHDALKFLRKLEAKFLNEEKVATIGGRFFGMDRNKRWPRTELAYNQMVLGEGLKAHSAEEAILQAYNRGETDEYIQPTVITDAKGRPVSTVKDNDGIIFFNLRSDRARQLTKVFVQKDFYQKNPGSFKPKKTLKNLRYVAMTDFGPDLDHILTAYPSNDLKDTLPMVLKDYDQLYIGETEKYAHVTFFFNGGYDSTVAGEERILIPSPNKKFYANSPAMSAFAMTDILMDKIKRGKQFVAVNYCNADMVGHSGNLKAAILSIEALDSCLKKLAESVLAKNGILIITADHGNAEEMIKKETNEVDTEHSNFPVPFILISNQHKKAVLRKDGILADVAPTIIKIFDLPKPKLMTGKSLFK